MVSTALQQLELMDASACFNTADSMLQYALAELTPAQVQAKLAKNAGAEVMSNSMTDKPNSTAARDFHEVENMP